MLARLQTFSLLGIDAVPVDVEVDVSTGALPSTVLVGLPDPAIRESTHRVARAMVNSGFNRPNDRIVINLAPAEFLLDSHERFRPPQGLCRVSSAETSAGCGDPRKAQNAQRSF
jgi:hypothetical protein